VALNLTRMGSRWIPFARSIWCQPERLRFGFKLALKPKASYSM
jgi:hypothetical protein